MNSMIAATIMMNQKPKLSFLEIKQTTKMMYEHILGMNYKTYCPAGPENYDIYQAVLNLGYKVEGKALDKKKGDKAMVVFSGNESFKTELALSFYGNQFGSHLINEAVILQAICHLTNFNLKGNATKPVSLQEIQQFFNYLVNLFSIEFINLSDLDQDEIQVILDHFQDLNLIQYVDSNTIQIVTEPKHAKKIY